jgi:cytochrome c oxidase subunit IV
MERHPLDLVSLVAGVIFSLVGLAFLVGALGSVDVQLRWLWPVVLVVLGLALLAGNRPGRSRQQPDL